MGRYHFTLSELISRGELPPLADSREFGEQEFAPWKCHSSSFSCHTASVLIPVFCSIATDTPITWRSSSTAKGGTLPMETALVKPSVMTKCYPFWRAYRSG